MKHLLGLVLAALLTSATARAEMFPDAPYYGMQIDYKVEGIAPTDFEDRETTKIVTRVVGGILTGKKVRISGKAYSTEDGAELTLSLAAGFDVKKERLRIELGQKRLDFSLEIDVPPKARGSHIAILINPDTKSNNLVKALRLDVTGLPKK
jgi:hypothetical protein